MFTTLLLDADDTIFDFPVCEYNALKATVEGAGLRFGEDVFGSFHRINDALWKKLELNLVTRSELRVERFRQLVGACFAGYESADMLAESYIDNLSKQAVLLPDSLESVRLLSEQYAVYIITNGIGSVQRGRFSISPVTPCVRDIFISDELGAQKPNREFFDIALSRIEEKDKSRVLVVGDSLTSDMQGGRNAGLTTCLFDPRDRVALPHPLCDMKIHSLRELLK